MFGEGDCTYKEVMLFFLITCIVLPVVTSFQAATMWVRLCNAFEL